MASSIEAILADARKLAMRLKEHDTSANCLISRTQALHRQLDAMKQFQDSLNELNEVARHRPRLGLIITLAQENSKIRELQQENKELTQSLDDHQSALQLIMSKYREQMTKLTKANTIEHGILQCSTDMSEDIEHKSEKVAEMAAVMRRAAELDDTAVDTERDELDRLLLENQLMRQLLQIEQHHSNDSACASTDKPLPPAAVPMLMDVKTQTGSGRHSEEEDGGGPFCGNDEFSTLRYSRSSSAATASPDVSSLMSSLSPFNSSLNDSIVSVPQPQRPSLPQPTVEMDAGRNSPPPFGGNEKSPKSEDECSELLPSCFTDNLLSNCIVASEQLPDFASAAETAVAAATQAVERCSLTGVGGEDILLDKGVMEDSVVDQTVTDDEDKKSEDLTTVMKTGENCSDSSTFDCIEMRKSEL